MNDVSEVSALAWFPEKTHRICEHSWILNLTMIFSFPLVGIAFEASFLAEPA